MSALIRTALTSLLGGGALPLILVALGVALFGFGFLRGGASEAARCRTAELEQTIKLQEAALQRISRQLSLAESARSAAARRAMRDAELSAQSKAEADAFKDQLRSRTPACRLDADDARRLRQIGR